MSCNLHNTSTFRVYITLLYLFGCMALVGSYFIWREFQNRLISLARLISHRNGWRWIISETAGIIHTILSFITFFFGGLSAIASYKLVKAPFAYLSVLMGMISLIALVLFGSKIFMGLGPGGMERMIAYPLLLWLIGFGGNLMSSEL